MISGLLVAIVRIYQLTISPFLGARCRFEPSCSHYTISCLKLHGAWRGTLLSLLRLSKCHPFHPGGYDPPPLALPTRRLPDDVSSRAAT